MFQVSPAFTCPSLRNRHLIVGVVVHPLSLFLLAGLTQSRRYGGAAPPLCYHETFSSLTVPILCVNNRWPIFGAKVWGYGPRKMESQRSE